VNSRRVSKVIALLAAIVALAVITSSFASAGPKKPKAPAAHKVVKAKHAKKAQSLRKAQQQGAPGESEAASSESDGDAAQQNAACKAAGIDPNGSNVNYDDATGKCSLDGGSADGQ
jgi:hypothetical protein